jgi:6-phospho-3-hexuloisomerase
MQDLGFGKAAGLILAEIDGVLTQVREEDAEAFEEAVLRAGTVFVTGEGRSGLLAKCFAMRLMHLGLQAHAVGDAVTPRLSPGDLLVAVSGSGQTKITNLLAESAARQGARVAALSSSRDTALARAADLLIVVPAPSKQTEGRGSVQYGGTLFEQSAFLLLDTLALRLQRRLGETAEQMEARHATLE